MIRKLALKNFKSFRESTIALGPLSIILGANASGKSNFVDALRFLQGNARGLTLSEIFSGRWSGGQQTWMPIRGGEREAFNLSQQSKRLDIGMEFESRDAEKFIKGAYHFAIEISEEKLHFVQERFVSDDDEYVYTGRETADTASLSTISFNTPAPFKIKAWASILNTWLYDGIYFPAFSPALMREYVSSKRTDIGLRGENLSSVLLQMTSNIEQRQTLLEWLQELCPQEIIDFEFVQTQLGDVLMAIKEPNGAIISARSMSDGTLRFLAIVVALLHAEEGSLFVLEDIDSDLHPSRLHLLVSFLEQVTASRRIQVIATSHSPYLLDYLSEQSLANVLVFARDRESRCSKVSNLVDIPGFSEARQHNPLDLLHASGWMEQNL